MGREEEVGEKRVKQWGEEEGEEVKSGGKKRARR